MNEIVNTKEGVKAGVLPNSRKLTTQPHWSILTAVFSHFQYDKKRLFGRWLMSLCFILST